MAIYIAAVHLSGGTEHKHIASVIWVNEGTMQSGLNSTAEMVDFINQGNSVKVGDGKTKVDVIVVTATPPYIRTVADGKWTDNLLALPRY
jgi:catechol-2,3-dioxygenase